RDGLPGRADGDWCRTRDECDFSGERGLRRLVHRTSEGVCRAGDGAPANHFNWRGGQLAMNRLEALRPITRRALRIFYASPDICAPVEESSGTGTSCSVESNLDFEAVTRATGPVLSIEDADGGFTLTWTEVPDASMYFLYR